MQVSLWYLYLHGSTSISSSLPPEALASLGDAQRQLLQQIMQLSDDIAKLQPTERLQIMQLGQAMYLLNLI